MKRIICVGNRFCPQDAAGPRVYDRLAGTTLPPGVEVIDGGLAGLDLLRFVEGAERVIFVDAVSGFAAPSHIAVLEGESVAQHAEQAYGHSAGLAYLLRALPLVCAGPAPQILLVGIEGPAEECTIASATELCLNLTANRGTPQFAHEPQHGGATT
ncbi:MAG: hydrogenase maturation protease [Planctomycetes bacterium]|nr:hydrogenase maturation protease [Planctomycetota bacterium]